MPRKSKKQMMADCVAWNNANQLGSEVLVKKDNGEEVRARSRGEAFMCNAPFRSNAR